MDLVPRGGGDLIDSNLFQNFAQKYFLADVDLNKKFLSYKSKTNKKLKMFDFSGYFRFVSFRNGAHSLRSMQVLKKIREFRDTTFLWSIYQVVE